MSARFIDYSVFRDAHPRTGQMGWAAQALLCPDEELLRYRWYPDREEAQKACDRWRINKVLGEAF